MGETRTRTKPEEQDAWLSNEQERMREFRDATREAAFAEAALEVEMVANNLVAWLTTLPIDSPQRVELSLRAGERFVAAKQIRLLSKRASL